MAVLPSLKNIVVKPVKVVVTLL